MKPQQGLNKWNQAQASLKMQSVSQADAPSSTVESEKYNPEPSSKSANALEQLFRQAQGLRALPTRTYSPAPAAPTYKPVVGGEPKPDLSAYTPEQCVYHSALLIEAGLVDGSIINNGS